jgi:hypothetical protein
MPLRFTETPLEALSEPQKEYPCCARVEGQTGAPDDPEGQEHEDDEQQDPRQQHDIEDGVRA